MKRGSLLALALTISGLASLFMLWVQIQLVWKVFVLTNVARWADVVGWFEICATVIVVLSAISDRPVHKHGRFIKGAGITVVCLDIIQFLFNHIYVSIQMHHFM